MIAPGRFGPRFQRFRRQLRFRGHSAVSTIARLLPLRGANYLILRNIWAGSWDILCGCSFGWSSPRGRAWFALQLGQQRTERLLRKLHFENRLDFPSQPLPNAIQARSHQVRPAGSHIGLDLRRELTVGPAAFQHPHQLLGIATAQSSPPPSNRLGIVLERVLEHSQTHPGVVQSPHQHLETGLLPIRRHDLQQLQPVINVQLLPILLLLVIDGEKGITFVSPKNQLPGIGRGHRRAYRFPYGHAP